jgi:hypothetical protein
VRVTGVVRRAEVVPDRDPVEAELLDALPERLQVGDARVLQSCGLETRPIILESGMTSAAMTHVLGSSSVWY